MKWCSVIELGKGQVPIKMMSKIVFPIDFRWPGMPDSKQNMTKKLFPQRILKWTLGGFLNLSIR